MIIPKDLLRGVAASLWAGLVVLSTGSTALAQDEVPVPPPASDDGVIAFGMAGLARLQAATLSVVAIGGGTPDPSTVCRVGLGFRDASGQLFRDASGMDIAAEFSLGPGLAVRLDLREADAFRGRTGRRVALRADVRLLDPPAIPPGSCGPVVATLEVVDTWTGHTALFYPSDPTEPDFTPFGMVGLGRLQTGRLNLVAVGGGSPDPTALPVCPIEVGFVDDMGDPFRDASGMPIAMSGVLAPGQAAFLDLRAVDAFRGATGLRVAFRPVVRVLPDPSGGPCQRPVPTLEVFDIVTGRSTLLYAPSAPR